MSWFLAALIGLSAAPAPLRITGPRAAYPHRLLTFHISIDPHADNRALIVQAQPLDESGTFRSSAQTLDGEATPKGVWLRWDTGLESGDYQITAGLANQRGDLRATASIPLHIQPH